MQRVGPNAVHQNGLSFASPSATVLYKDIRAWSYQHAFYDELEVVLVDGTRLLVRSPGVDCEPLGRALQTHAPDRGRIFPDPTWGGMPL